MANVVQPQYTDDTGQYDLIFSADGIAIKVNDTYTALPQYLNDLINDIKNTYANKTHTHTVSNITDFPTSLPASDVSSWAKAKTKPTYTYTEVGADEKGSADAALKSAKSYTDTKISDLINGAPETLDTLKELADALETSSSTIEVLNEAIGKKANAEDLTAHTSDIIVHTTPEERTKWNKAYELALTASGVNPGEPNVITSISVNGVNITPSDKNVDITVPTKVSSLYNDSNYATTDDLAKVQINKSQIKDFTHTHDLTDINGLIVSADELNYIDGVTSSVQTQINTVNKKVSSIDSTLTNTKVTVTASTDITCNIDAYKSGESCTNGKKIYNKISLIGTASKSDAFIAESEIDLCTINITCKQSYLVPISAVLIDSAGAITQDCVCYFKVVDTATHLFLSVPASLKSNAFNKVSISGSVYIWTEGEG